MNIFVTKKQRYANPFATNMTHPDCHHNRAGHRIHKHEYFLLTLRKITQTIARY